MDTALLHLERNGALFGVHGLVRSKGLDTADIVRDGDFSLVDQRPRSFRVADDPEVGESTDTSGLLALNPPCCYRMQAIMGLGCD